MMLYMSVILITRESLSPSALLPIFLAHAVDLCVEGVLSQYRCELEYYVKNIMLKKNDILTIYIEVIYYFISSDMTTLLVIVND